MLELLKSNDRAKFRSKNCQVKWFEKILRKITVSEIAKLCACSERTVRDWKKGKFMPSYSGVSDISQKLKIEMPHVVRFSRSVSAKYAGKKGGAATMKKHGRVPVNEDARKSAWLKWWKEKGRCKEDSITQPLPVFEPTQDVVLSEFIGIMIGDGTVSDYHIAISLNTESDKEYISYVSGLIERLFKIKPNIYRNKNRNVSAITLSRVCVVRFLQRVGLPKGDKLAAGIHIPSWILCTEEYAKACVRGLIDTDGSIYVHSYTSKGRRYVYNKIAFTSASALLRRQVYVVLSKIGVEVRLVGSDVRIEKQSEVKKYLALIGTNNPKFLKRLDK